MNSSGKQTLIKLAEKYNRQLPRYTSYPTALELKEIQKENPLDFYAHAIKQNSSFSLYVHLPHCPKLCYFCACNKVITKEYQPVKDYLLPLEKEFQMLSRLIQDKGQVVQIHLGGGSPSYLATEELSKLDQLFIKYFPLAEVCQKSIEVDPRSFSSEKASLLKKQNYQRFSLGVQDFDPKVQKLINRIQPFDLTSDTIKDLRYSSDCKINLDLIYGLPAQSIETFKDTLEKVISLQPDRIALYAYAHVAWKVKVQNVFNKHSLPDSAQRIQLLALAVETLSAAGYQYIGLDHFALPEDELSVALRENRLKRNFMGYTTVDGDYQLATGVSAISDLDDYLIQNTTDISQYQGMLESNSLACTKFLQRSSEDKLRATIIEKLMCERKLDFTALQDFFPDNNINSIINTALPELQEFVADGLIEINNKQLIVNESGFFFLRNIAAVFDAYLKKELNSQKKRFSTSV